MPELPTGTVTFLFTDIEGSTRQLQELGAERYADALAKHRRSLREAFARHGGVEVDTQGDAFFVAFPTAPDALAAAAEGTAALADGPIRARMGLHTGTPFVSDEGYVGTDVHRAARIAAAGHGGQVVVSASTYALSPDGDAFRDLGEHRLKDLASPERLWQLGDGEFPPLTSLYRTNLPVPQTVFLGRAEEVRAVAELVVHEDVRLVTLTGPGGTGKTRLALQAAAEAADAFPDGITWIALASLREPALVLPALAGALGIEDGGGGSADLVASALAGKDALLVLDNAEHLLPELADEIAPVLEVAGPKLLVTSRERLQLAGEHIVDVPPLDEHEGVELFLTRARAAGVEVARSPTVTELCRRLDHLPLALELAAARTPLLSPDQLLERIGRRLDLLKAGRRVDARQKTLRATVEWSHDLLADNEQRLFRRLAVFVGGCTIEAAEEVCDADPDGLQSLLAKSLLRRRDGAIGPRYWMLETIRELAAERLAASDEAAELAARHARWYADLGTRNYLAFREDDDVALATFDAELPNLRAALAWALSAHDVASAGDLLFALWFLWLSAGHGREAADAASAWLELDGKELTPLERVPGLLAVGEIVRFTGDQVVAEGLKWELIEVCRAHVDEEVHDWPLRRMLAAALTDVSTIELEQGRLDEAERHAMEGLALRREMGVPSGVAHALTALASVSYARRDFAGCRELLRQSHTGWLDSGRTAEAAQAQTGIAECAVLLGDLESAARLLKGAIDVVARGRDEIYRTYAAYVAAMLAGAHGEHEDAARLLGAVETLDAQRGIAVQSRYELEVGGEFFAKVAQARGREEFDRARADGRELGEQELFELAAAVARRHANA